MKVRLPFPVLCSRVLRGKRSYSEGYVVFEDTFDVKSVEAKDTVVVATIMHAGVAKEVYRFHEGYFYRPACLWLSDFKETDGTFPDDGGNADLGALLVNGGGPLMEKEFLYEYSRLNSSLREVKSHDVLRFDNADAHIEHRRDLARIAYEELTLVIDGMAWARIDEPHFILERPLRGFAEDETTINIAVSERRPVPGQRGGFLRKSVYEPPSLCPTFRLDRLEEMTDFINECRREDGLETEVVSPELEVIRSEFLNYDDEADNLVRSADQVLDMSQSELRGASKAFVDAWHEVDVAVAAGLRSLDDFPSSDIESGLQTIGAISNNQKVKKVASRTLDRYSMRAIGPAYR
jgi:hypothetical protein